MLTILRARLALAVALACVSAVFVAVASGRASVKPTASQLLKTAFADAAASGSVHELQTEMDGSGWFKASDDVFLHNGRQEITKSDGTDAHVVLLGATGYVSGNQKALVSYFGLPPSVARAVGVRWIRVPASDPWYRAISADATLPSALSEVKPTGPLVELPATTQHGQSVIGIRGNMPKGFKGAGTDTVFVTKAAHPVPVAAVFARGGRRVTDTFSNWAERINLSAPTNSVPSNQL